MTLGILQVFHRKFENIWSSFLISDKSSLLEITIPKGISLAQSILTLSWRGPLSYKNQSIDLQSKLMDWFLYDNGLRHERVKSKCFLDLEFYLQKVSLESIFLPKLFIQSICTCKNCHISILIATCVTEKLQCLSYFQLPFMAGILKLNDTFWRIDK